MLPELEIIKLNKSDVERYIEYVHRVVVHVYQKYLTRLGGLIIFESWRDIRQQYVDLRILFIHKKIRKKKRLNHRVDRSSTLVTTWPIPYLHQTSSVLRK